MRKDKRYIAERFKIKGMVCGSCEKIISKGVSAIKGVKEVRPDFNSGICEVVFDRSRTNLGEIKEVIVSKGYSCVDNGNESSGGASTIIAIILLIGAYMVISPFMDSYAPSLDQNVSLWLLFIVGLFTGFHCIAMCGGFVMSYTAKDASEKKQSYLSHLVYGVAKTATYVLFGAIFGLLGSFVTFTPMLRGAASIIAGGFLIIFSLNMLGFNLLRRFRLITPSFISGSISKSNNPAVIGILNGLMFACGPLQIVYLMAAASGSPYVGASYLFAFGLGTLPLLLGFGVIASFLSKSTTRGLLRYSGIIVLILGMIMVNRGLILTGSGYDAGSILTMQGRINQSVYKVDNGGYQIINMNVTANGWQPDTFVLKKGVSVKWVINGLQLTGCNNAIQVPKYGLRFDLKPGIQTIEFTPTEDGTVPWSCYMGMIRGTFIVKDNINLKDDIQIKSALAEAPKKPSGTCSMGSGGSGCGCGM